MIKFKHKLRSRKNMINGEKNKVFKRKKFDLLKKILQQY